MEALRRIVWNTILKYTAGCWMLIRARVPSRDRTHEAPRRAVSYIYNNEVKLQVIERHV